MNNRLYYGDNPDILRNRGLLDDDGVDMPTEQGTFKRAARQQREGVSAEGRSQRDLNFC